MFSKILNFIKRNPIISIILVGVVLRLIWIFTINTYPETDFMWYHVKGMELSEGKGFLNGIYPYYIGQEGFPTAFRPIGYPGTLAILYYFLGSNFFVGQFFNIFLSALIMFYGYKLAFEFLGKKVALFSLILYAFSPLAITYTSILGSETLFSALLVLSSYFYLVKRNPYASGFLIGYLTLVRPIGVLVPSIFIVFEFFRKQVSIKEKFKFLAVFFTLFVLVFTPWLLRNYIVFGTPTFSTNGGYVFYVNNNDYATGSWSDPFKYPNSPMLQYRYEDRFDEMAIHKLGNELAIEWIKNNPSRFMFLGFKRLANSYWFRTDDIMWSMTIDLDTWHPMTSRAVFLQKVIYRPFYLVLFAYIIFSAINFVKFKKADLHLFVLLVFGYFNSMMFVLEGNSRYVFPLHPFYFIGVAFIILKATSPFQKLHTSKE